MSSAWHSKEVSSVIQELKADSVNGLSNTEAQKRLAQYGLNEIEKNGHSSPILIFLRQFTDVLVIILLLATVIALAMKETEDAIAIFSIILLNGLLGFIQEWKAEKAMDALRRMLALQCKVIRDGQEQEIDARYLVPGDIVLLETGDQVPADLRLIETVNLKIDESILTGESLSVEKRVEAVGENQPLATQYSMAFMGTSVTNGYARAVVVSTNMKTEFGQIAHLTGSVKKEMTPLQKKLAKLGQQLGMVSLMVALLVAIFGWWTGKPWSTMFFVGISLAVAAVPEGLPAIVTMTMALGIRAMAKRKALLRRLRSAETLGCATVICTDKTGTLTQNAMTVTQVLLPRAIISVTGNGYEPIGHFEKDHQRMDPTTMPDLDALLTTASLCNHAKLIRENESWKVFGEPTEAALLVLSHKAWLKNLEKPTVLNEFSFNSNRKRMTVIIPGERGYIAHMKGAPEVILDRCSHYQDGEQIRPLTVEDRRRFESKIIEMAKEGLRTLAFAMRPLAKNVVLTENEVEKDAIFLGVVAMMDPPRAEVTEAIATAKEAGIRTIMITGDSPLTALSIAQKIGITAEEAVTGPMLDSMDDAALFHLLKRPIIFARVTPEHKLRIVTVLQQQDEVVAMTGDGVNDAPALKKSDIGVAMGIRGTDVAREASDIVLTDDNYASIVNAIEEGRRQYDNIRKFVHFLVSSNLGEIIAILLNIVFQGPLMLLPVQILWVNLITDGIIAMSLGMEPADKRLMHRKPVSPSAPIMSKRSLIACLLTGSYIGCLTFGLFLWGQKMFPEQLVLAQTIAFVGLILVEKLSIFNFRSLDKPLFKIGLFSNRWFWLAWLVNLGFQLCAIYVPFFQKFLRTVPLSGTQWLIMLGLALPLLLVSEAYKYIQHRRLVG